MRVLIIDHMLPGNRYSLELCQSLSRVCDVSLATTIDARSCVGNATHECFPILFGSSHGGNKVASAPKYLLGMVRLLFIMLSGNYDVVHVQTFKRYFLEMPFYRMLKKLGAIKCLAHTVHNVVQHSTTKEEVRAYSDFYKVCDLLLVHNKLSRDELLKYVDNAGKIVITPHGCYRVEGIVHEKKQDPTVFLTLGVMRKNKGIDLLLEGASYLEKEYRSKCRILIVGSADKDNPIDYQATANALGVDGFVSIKQSFVSDTELAEYHKRAHFCVFPYLNIYGSGALLMAYSHGVPVIVSDIPAFIEETENGSTGLLFNAGDASSMAEALREAIDMCDLEYGHYVEEVSELRDRKYSWNNSAKILYDSYMKVRFE